MLWAVIVYAIPRVLLLAGMVLLGQWGIEFCGILQLLPANLFQFGAKVVCLIVKCCGRLPRE